MSQLLRKGEFREDLYYRINVVPIVIPPLRERKEDIPILIDHFVRKFNAENNKNVKGVIKEVLELMMNYEWPGNVRELENLIERVIALTSNESIQADELPFSFTPFQNQWPKRVRFKGKVSFSRRKKSLKEESS